MRALLAAALVLVAANNNVRAFSIGTCSSEGRILATTSAARHSVESSHEQHEEDDSSFALSKAKWKKKRFLMLKDVRNSIKLGHQSAVKRAQEMLDRWWKLYELSGNDATFLPTTEAYNLYLNALAKSSDPDSGSKAEEVLKSMEKQIVGIQPNIVSYTTLMDAYARKKDPTAAAAAERVLFDLITLSETVRPDLQVTSVTCDTALNAYAQQGTWQGAERAEQILYRLQQLGGDKNIRPTAHSYATVINGWAKCRGGSEAAVRAQAILKNLLSTKNSVRPDTVIFNACIHAWANSRDPACGSKAVQLMDQMRQLYERGGYNCAPDTVTYNSVLSAWSHSGHANAANQAERVLQQMVVGHRNHPDSAPAPCTDSYNNVLNAWSKSPMEGAAKRAQTILEFMIKSPDDNLSPDVYSFTSVLDALAKSKEPDKAVRARTLLDKLLEMNEATHNPNLRPSQVPFNTVMNAAAFSKTGTTEEQQRQALQVAVQTFSLMRAKGIPPDEVSYGIILKCFHNLIPPGLTRTNMAMNVFQKCCEEGYVGDMVWNQMRNLVPSDQLSALLKNNRKPLSATRVVDLPRSWRSKCRASSSSKTLKQRRRGKKSPDDDGEKRTTPPLRRFRNISEASYQSGRDL